MKNLLKMIDYRYNRRMPDEFQRKRIQLIEQIIVIGVVSGGMSLFELFVGNAAIWAGTAVFAVSCLIAAVIGTADKNGKTFTSVFLSISIVAMPVFLTIFGGQDVIVWVMLLPTCGLFSFGVKKGSILSAIGFIAICFCFHTEAGRSLLQKKDYTEVSMLRMPFIYIGFWIAAVFVTFQSEEAYRQLDDSKKRYRHLTKHDELTSLYNRAGFNNEMNGAIKGSDEGQPFALLIIDIDDFKRVNDNCGHLAGDRVLVILSKMLRAGLGGEESVICRWGGEEFAVLLFGDSGNRYAEIAEKLRFMIEKTSYGKSRGIYFTVSIGGVRSTDVSVVSDDSMIRAADARLYTAKRAGKNQVCTAEASDGEPEAAESESEAETETGQPSEPQMSMN